MPLTVVLGGCTYEVAGAVDLAPYVAPPASGLPPANGAEISPTMTGPASPAGYQASATSEYVEAGVIAAAWRAFNKVAGSGWANGWSSVAQATPATPQALTLTLPQPKPCYNYSVRIRSDAVSTAPRAWTLEGYDGAAWVPLHSVAGLTWVNGETKTFSVPSPASCSGYRLRCTDSGVYCQIDEWRLFS